MHFYDALGSTNYVNSSNPTGGEKGLGSFNILQCTEKLCIWWINFPVQNTLMRNTDC